MSVIWIQVCFKMFFLLFPFQLHLIHWNSTTYSTLEEAMGKPHGISIIALFIQVWIIILIILNYSPLFCVWYLLTHLSGKREWWWGWGKGNSHMTQKWGFMRRTLSIWGISFITGKRMLWCSRFFKIFETKKLHPYKSKHYLDTYNANERVWWQSVRGKVHW